MAIELHCETYTDIGESIAEFVKGLRHGQDLRQAESDIIDFTDTDGNSFIKCRVNLLKRANAGYATDQVVQAANTKVTTTTTPNLVKSETVSKPETQTTSEETILADVVTERREVRGEGISTQHTPYHEIEDRAQHPTTESTTTASGGNTTTTNTDYDSV